MSSLFDEKFILWSPDLPSFYRKLKGLATPFEATTLLPSQLSRVGFEPGMFAHRTVIVFQGQVEPNTGLGILHKKLAWIFCIILKRFSFPTHSNCTFVCNVESMFNILIFFVLYLS